MTPAFTVRQAALLAVGFGGLALALLQAATPAAPAAAPVVLHTILFFGDSLTAGLGLDQPKAEGFPGLIQKKLDAAKLPWRVVNAGVSGDTSADGARRIDWVLGGQPVDIFVLELGANDGLRGLTVAALQANLQTIIDKVRAKFPAAKIILAGMRLPGSMGADYTRDFAAVFPALAEKDHLILIPFLLEGIGLDPALNQADRLHPTAAGDRVVAETVWKILQPAL